jgi:tripartite-type tricarboxylate transporter receptor subunit TctC
MRNRIHFKALRGGAAAALAAVTVAGAATAARADAVADYYQGRNLSVIISFAPGGGYDTYARTIIQHMPGHIPGKPTMVLQHMPGGGGVKAANYFENVAPKDGSVIGMIADSIGVALKLKPAGAKFDPAKWEYIGRAVTAPTVLLVHKTAPATTLEGLRSKEVVIGSTGLGSMSYIGPKLFTEMLGLKLKIVSGYRGTNPILLAIEKNEVQAVNFSWTSIKAVRGQWLKDGTLIPLVEFALEHSDDLPNIPLASSLAKDEDTKKAMAFVSHYAGIGRAFVAPPGFPADRLAALRKAFDDTMKDPAFLADAKKRKMVIAPATGEQVNNIMRTAMQTPDSVIAKAKAALARKK